MTDDVKYPALPADAIIEMMSHAIEVPYIIADGVEERGKSQLYALVEASIEREWYRRKFGPAPRRQA